MSEPSKWRFSDVLPRAARTRTADADVIPMQTSVRFDFQAKANEIVEAMNKCVIAQCELGRSQRAWNDAHKRLVALQGEVRQLQAEWIEQSKQLDIPPPGAWPMPATVGPPSYAVMPQEPPTISMEVESHG